MLLRVSSQVAGHQVDPRIAVTGSGQGVPQAAELLAFAAAAFGDTEQLPAAREALAEAVGAEGLVDAAAAVGNFLRQVRVADGVGLRLDPPMAMLTVDMREQLGIDAFTAAANTPKVGLAGKWMGRMLGPFVPRIMKSFTPSDVE